MILKDVKDNDSAVMQLNSVIASGQGNLDQKTLLADLDQAVTNSLNNEELNSQSLQIYSSIIKETFAALGQETEVSREDFLVVMNMNLQQAAQPNDDVEIIGVGEPRNLLSEGNEDPFADFDRNYEESPPTQNQSEDQQNKSVVPKAFQDAREKWRGFTFQAPTTLHSVERASQDYFSYLKDHPSDVSQRDPALLERRDNLISAAVKYVNTQGDKNEALSQVKDVLSESLPQKGREAKNNDAKVRYIMSGVEEKLPETPSFKK